ncbi:hypothetical protein BDY24DRAFT_413291 [Mrakia frigida]|uniref:uncharacterized protein n=1 Tax=Mrakia frigida TaxID=29902 RepID=UPI003FCC06B8
MSTSTKRSLPTSTSSGLSAKKRQKLLQKPSNRPVATSTSSSFPHRSSASSPSGSASDADSGSEDDDEDDDDDPEAAHQAMLRALEAHGRAMFGEVVAPPFGGGKGKGREELLDENEDEDEEDEGWDEDDDDEEEEDDEFGDDGEDGEEEEEEGGKKKVELASASIGGGPRLPEIVFAPAKYQSSESSRADYKAFMSSKASKILADPLAASSTGSTKVELDTEKANLTLDKTLHSLLLTSLLAPTTHSSSPRALQGRLNELAGATKLGEGERDVRKKEVGKLGGKNVVGRGMRKVGLQRWQKGEADARERGDTGLQLSTPSIYAPSTVPASSSRRQKDADRGLSMGVGRFTSGVLKLSQGDLEGVKKESVLQRYEYLLKA